VSGVDEAARKRFLEQLESMKRAYVARFPERADELDALRARLDEGDATAVLRVEELVHALAGTAGSYGLDDISVAATALDIRVKGGAPPASLVADLGELISLLRRTV